MAPSQRVVPTLDDPESQRPPADPATQAKAQRRRARPSVSFSSSFCASLVVVWAVLLAVSFARDNAPSECDATPPNITNITRNPACDAPMPNATKAAADEVEPSRFVRMLLDAMDVSCGCMDEKRLSEMYTAPTSVIFSATMVYVVFVIYKWARRLYAAVQADLDKADETRDKHARVSRLLRVLFWLRRVQRDAEALAPSDNDDDDEACIAKDMSLIYTDGKHIVQAEVIELEPSDVEPGWRRGKVKKLKLFHHRRTEEKENVRIDLIKRTITIDEETYEVAVDSSPTALPELIVAVLHVVLTYWGMYNYTQLAPDRGSWCWFVHIVLMPVFKPIAPSMWMALMSVGQFVLWRATASTPEGTRRATGTKLTGAPLPINVVTYACIHATALPLLVWFAAAVPFMLILIIIPLLWPLLIANLIVLSAMLIVGLPFFLARAERLLARCFPPDFEEVHNHDADPTDDEQARSLLLKVFAAVM